MKPQKSGGIAPHLAFILSLPFYYFVPNGEKYTAEQGKYSPNFPAKDQEEAHRTRKYKRGHREVSARRRELTKLFYQLLASSPSCTSMNLTLESIKQILTTQLWNRWPPNHRHWMAYTWDRNSYAKALKTKLTLKPQPIPTELNLQPKPSRINCLLERKYPYSLQNLYSLLI